ncbi:MAG: 50S ribosomal protein L3 [Bdellovibrio sp.]|nr:50S ribosomal protein L3 [Bdellovibrio sp.]
MAPDKKAAAESASEKSVVNLSSFYGQKAGMTRIFDEQGNHIPVTVIKLIPNHISQVKTKEKDGYNAYQVAYYEKREKLVPQPMVGHLKKAQITPVYTLLSELRMDKVDPAALGGKLGYESFKPSAYVDVAGTTKGKGYQGVMKRFNFAGGPAAHGSMFHRRPGSIGNRATPARVFKLKKLPGHMGDLEQTVQNLMVVEVNLDKGYMLIKGSVPGSKNGFVRISKAIKKARE